MSWVSSSWVSSSWVTNSSSSAQAQLILLHILNHLSAALLLVMMVVMVVVVMMPVIFHVVLYPAHDCRCIWCSSGGLRN
jgi:pilus assembly protein TadC